MDEGDFMMGSNRRRISGGEFMMGSRATKGEVGSQDLVDRESLVSAFGGKRREPSVRRTQRKEEYDEEEPYEEERYEEEPRGLLEM